jgi:hypothetical protein
MILNLLHRPTAQSDHPYFVFQQDVAHRLGLKVTLMTDYHAMGNQGLMDEVRRYQKEHGDEAGVWIWSLNDPECGGGAPFWLLSQDHKRKALTMILERFRAVFGCEPVSVGCYLMDASTMAILKELSPATTTVIAGCFEEGVKVFHGCNHSWYLFSEGMPWGPWYPSKTHSLRPAADKDDWAGFVAVPHLSRDLTLSYEGRNDFFASHPANVQRGMANVGADHPYDYNLADQYRLQEDYNDGFSFYHIHVSAGWLGYSPNIQDPPEISQQLYRELLEYMAELRSQGKLVDMYMREFGAWFRENVPVGKPFVNLSKDILYGSGKHYFWYVDPYFRVTVDMNQAGSIGDLRPYAAHFAVTTGPDSPHLAFNNYPYLIHSQYRTGTSNHYADGARTTLFVRHGDEILDLCRYRARCEDVQRDEAGTHVRLSPVTLEFKDGLSVKLQTSYHFPGYGQIIIERRPLAISAKKADVVIQEYLKGCYGRTEYPENMHGIRLELEGDPHQVLDFDYGGHSIQARQANAARVQIPQINTGLSLAPLNGLAASASASEGHLFNPYYTLTLDYPLNPDQEVSTCLTVNGLK